MDMIIYPCCKCFLSFISAVYFWYNQLWYVGVLFSKVRTQCHILYTLISIQRNEHATPFAQILHKFKVKQFDYCPACRTWTYLIATRFWVVVICPIIKCLTVLEFSFIMFDLCLFITIFNFILNYVPIVTFWIFTFHKIWILLIIFCFKWNYWIIYFFNMFGSVLECCELTSVSLLWPWLIKWK